MQWNRHSELAGKHAFLAPSKPHWINYSDDKFDRVFTTQQAAARGDRLHKLAADLIREGIKLPKTTITMNMYVNDCIGWKMTPEVALFYSMDAFGHADAMSFRENLLRISDLKTGLTPTKVQQLLAYAALFCLEYMYNPFEIDYELRIYQNNEILEFDVDKQEVHQIMDRIVQFSKRAREMREEAMA